MERFLVIPTLSGYEIRRERLGLLARLELGALDPRTLRDIGLHELAFRVAERQRLEAYWAGLC
jgi:hypothetical protein